MALEEVAFRHNGPLGILDGTSTLGRGICKVPFGDDRFSMDTLVGNQELTLQGACHIGTTEPIGQLVVC